MYNTGRERKEGGKRQNKRGLIRQNDGGGLSPLFLTQLLAVAAMAACLDPNSHMGNTHTHKKSRNSLQKQLVTYSKCYVIITHVHTKKAPMYCKESMGMCSEHMFFVPCPTVGTTLMYTPINTQKLLQILEFFLMSTISTTFGFLIFFCLSPLPLFFPFHSRIPPPPLPTPHPRTEAHHFNHSCQMRRREHFKSGKKSKGG